MSKKKRRHFSAEEKFNIAKQVLSKAKTVSEISDEYSINPNQYYRWQADFFEAALSGFDEEVRRFIEYRTNSDEIRNLGYRKFAWKMIDEGIALLTESSVYRILSMFKLLGKAFKENDEALKEYKNKPLHVHHHWHTDLAYVKIGIVYFIQETKEQYPHERPALIMDNGSQFISKDFKNLLSAINIRPVHTRRNHPQTNGKIERMNGIVKSEAIRKKIPQTYAEGISVMEDYEYEYNYNRVHAGINYLRAADVFFGRREVMLNERKSKILLAREKRIQYNNLRLKEFVS